MAQQEPGPQGLGLKKIKNLKSKSTSWWHGFPIWLQLSLVSIAQSRGLIPGGRHPTPSGPQQVRCSKQPLWVPCHTWDGIPSHRYWNQGVRASCQVAHCKTNASLCLRLCRMWLCEVQKPSSRCDWNVTVICNNGDSIPPRPLGLLLWHAPKSWERPAKETFRNVLNGFGKLVNPVWTFIRFSHNSPVWHQNKESIIYNSVCEIPEGTLERINVKNVSQRDFKHKTNDQMGKHVNQKWDLFFLL